MTYGIARQQDCGRCTDNLACQKGAAPSSRKYPSAVLAIMMFAAAGLANGAVTVSLNPSVVSLTPSQQQVFTPTVTGYASLPDTDYTLSAPIGTLTRIKNAMVYTAPAKITTPQTVTLIANSREDPTATDVSVITLLPSAGTTISIGPLTASITAAQSQQFSAVLLGVPLPGVTWSISPAVGSISAAGLYTAPSVLQSAQTVTITAQSIAAPALTASASLQLVPTTLSAAPLSATLSGGQTQQFTAAVGGGSTNQAVIWSISPAIGSISASGLYSAPVGVTNAQAVTVTAQSVAVPSVTGTSVVQLQATTVSIGAPGAALSGGQTQQLTATVAGTLNQAVTWSISPALGSISATGLYSAPVGVATAQAITVTAQSVAVPGATSTVTIQLQPIAISVGAPGGPLFGGQTQQLTATVTGAVNQGVTWSISPAVGSISATGLYSAPAGVASAQTITATAQSVAVPGVTGTTTVQLQPTTLSVTGAGPALYSGQTQQLTATVTGAVNQGVTWSISPAVGSISASGVYTAPATVPTPQTVTVTAQSVALSSLTASATVQLQSTVVSLTPALVSIAGGQTQQFSASVTGASQNVTWSLNPSVGSISTSGLYTAPASVSSNQSVTLTAQSASDATAQGVATIQLKVPTISLTPTSSTLLLGQTLQFTAAVANASNPGVTWAISPAVGTISVSGLYTPPATLAANQTVTVTVTSVGVPGLTKTAAIQLQIPVLTVTPAVSTLMGGQTQQFAASVSGTGAVAWSISPSVGTISTTGLYTAPISVPANQTVTVTAKNVATGALTTVPVTLQATPLQFTFGPTGVTSLSYNGQSYFAPVANIVQGGQFRSPTGVNSGVPFYSLNSAVKTVGPNSLQHDYAKGLSHAISVRMVWSMGDDHTLKTDVYVTNGDAVDSLAQINLMFMPLQLPATIQGRAMNVGFASNEYDGLPANFLTGTWGSLATWQDFPTSGNLRASYNKPNQTLFNFTLSNYVARNFQTATSKTGLTFYESPIPPGGTQHLTYYLRFGTVADSATTLAPEAFASFRTAYPNITSWPDRRPIAAWFMADQTKQSAINPRGYLGLPLLNAFDPVVFRQAMLNTAYAMVNRMNVMNPKPQGVVVWDIEGQELVQAFTYVGAPDRLSELSPEMDAVADEVLGVLRSAGYSIGVSVRPHNFQTGTVLPATCTYSTTYYLSDKFIKLDAPYPYRGYICSAPNVWTLAHANQPYEQVWSDDDTVILKTLERKISYARNRWGATMFYLDSNVYIKGDPIYAKIFRTLKLEFPDILLIPETVREYHYGTATTHVAAAYFNNYIGTPQAYRSVYPDAFSVVDIASSAAASNLDTLAQAVKNGDIMMFPGYWAAPEIGVVQQIYALAATLP